MDNDQQTLEDWELLDALNEMESSVNARANRMYILHDPDERVIRFQLADGRRTMIGFETFERLLRHTRDFCQACRLAQVRDLDLREPQKLRLICTECEAVHILIADRLYLTDE